MPKLTQKYETLRKRLPKERDEVKGRLLAESHVAAVIDLLVKNHAIFESTAVDVGAHQEDGVIRYRDELVNYMERIRSRFNASAQREVDEAVLKMRKTSAPLFLQAIVTMDVLEKVISHVPLYFSQRQPWELVSFQWVVDGKERNGVTNWERWWSTYCQGVLASRSKSRPGPVLEGADTSHFDRMYGKQCGDEIGTDLSRLLSDIRFSATPEPGLELVDIVTNAVRRALTGNLAKSGWGELRRIMIHRREHYVGLKNLEGASQIMREPQYADVIRHFREGGRNMLAPRFSRQAECA